MLIQPMSQERTRFAIEARRVKLAGIFATEERL